MAIFHNGKQIQDLYHNGKQIESVYHNGIKIYQAYYPTGTAMYANTPFALTGTTSYTGNSGHFTTNDGNYSLYMVTNTSQISLSKEISKCQNGIKVTFNTWGLEPDFSNDMNRWYYSEDIGLLSSQPIIYLKKSDTSSSVSGTASYAGESGKFTLYASKVSDTSIKIYNIQESNGTSILQAENTGGSMDDVYATIASITAY